MLKLNYDTAGDGDDRNVLHMAIYLQVAIIFANVLCNMFANIPGFGTESHFNLIALFAQHF